MDRNNVLQCNTVIDGQVALRKESVDRNTSIDNLTQGVFKSLSARRAWIEIAPKPPIMIRQPVALRKESVDRNP